MLEAAAAHVGEAAISAPAARGLVKVEAHRLGAARFSLSILSSKVLSTGLESPRGEAMPGVKRL